MKKIFRLTDLDCAHCAAKIETAISKIPGVIEASASFMTQKLILEAEETDFENILPQVRKIIAQIEPDCEIED